MTASKIAYLTYETFCLGLLRPFAVSFCLCAMETTYSRDILPPNILLLVLQFFQICLILPFLIHQILTLVSTFIFSDIRCSFCCEILRHVHLQFLIYISRKNHMWLTRKVEHCPAFWKSDMINHNAQILFDFFKYIIWFVIYD